MVGEAGSVEWIVTGGEVEALQLEVSMIKQHRPRFNVRYRDDKSYPYLTVTMTEEVPRAMVVRGRKKKGNRYWGPYAHAYAIRDTLDLLLRAFPIRSCSQGVFDRARRARRPCLLYDIGRCSAPCTGFVSAEGHREIVRRFSEFMDGDHATVLKELNAGMQAASEVQEFERAARMRDQIAAVRRVIEKQQMVTEKSEDIDVVAWAGDELESAFQVFFVRKGRMVGRKGFIVDRVEDLSDEELAESFLETLYSEQDDLPKQVLTPVVPKDAEVIEEWLSLGRGSKVTVRVPERGDKRALLETVERNAEEAFARNRLRRAGDFTSRSVALNGLQTNLELPEAPLRIECFDISNLGPSEVVGSMVVFEDALPKKSDYRKFKVRSVPGQDDVGAMREVIERRFARLLEEEAKPRDSSSRFAYRPGLVIVDGGKGQLNAALEAMKEVGVVDVPVAALAKRYEEVYLPGESGPRVVPRGSEALYLLQRIRDEAHRFAVTYQRARRTKAMTRSVLDRLPGVGEARRKALVKHFGSAKGVLGAGVDELAGVPGISRALAERIYEHIRRSA
jgi:excinuclease ABC subunit C